MRETWNCLYPVYFDSSFSLKNGRRVPKSSSSSSPTINDIYSSCLRLGILEEHLFLEESKRHPSSQNIPGRIRVMLKEEKGDNGNNSTTTPLYPSFPNTNSLIKAINELK